MIFFMSKWKFEKTVNDIVSCKVKEEVSKQMKYAIINLELKHDIQKVIDYHNWVFDDELKEKIKDVIETNESTNLKLYFGNVSEVYYSATSLCVYIQVTYYVQESLYNTDHSRTLTFARKYKEGDK